MNRKLSIGLFASAAIFMVACGGPQGERAITGDAQNVAEKQGVTYVADLATSNVEWIGTKPTGQHNGTISLSEGYAIVSNGAITGGEFIFDMNSIVDIDLTDPDMNGKLTGHLKSGDFFEIETYPTSKFIITSVEANENSETGETHMITGNLTMKDVTKSISFTAMVSITDLSIKATSNNFLINRADWNIKYGSKRFFDNLKDNFIHDDISLKVNFFALNK
ncbi:MAG: YceI family protein [Bacteroidales bacterium]|nr:YceI family protein [Bacteroidales bacterium]MDZ4203239.1 YceI family protein [Bacteroidales bacterium]